MHVQQEDGSMITPKRDLSRASFQPAYDPPSKAVTQATMYDSVSFNYCTLFAFSEKYQNLELNESMLTTEEEEKK